VKSSNYLIFWNRKEGWCGSDEVVVVVVVAIVAVVVVVVIVVAAVASLQVCLHRTLIVFILA
jgi:hypothetical protein